MLCQIPEAGANLPVFFTFLFRPMALQFSLPTGHKESSNHVGYMLSPATKELLQLAVPSSPVRSPASQQKKKRKKCFIPRPKEKSLGVKYKRLLEKMRAEVEMRSTQDQRDSAYQSHCQTDQTQLTSRQDVLQEAAEDTKLWMM